MASGTPVKNIDLIMISEIIFHSPPPPLLPVHNADVTTLFPPSDYCQIFIVV